VVYTANWEQSDFNSFGPEGGIIEVLYQTDSSGSSGLSHDFSLSFEFAPFSDQHFSFNASVFTAASELMIGVNEAYSTTIADTSQLTVESAPEFAGWNLDERVLDQAGMSVLRVYEDPATSLQILFETTFQNDDITRNPPPSGVFKNFALTYVNIVPPEVPADKVPRAGLRKTSKSLQVVLLRVWWPWRIRYRWLDGGRLVLRRDVPIPTASRFCSRPARMLSTRRRAWSV